MTRMNDSTEQLLDGLDDAQREAATTLDGPVRIIAVAGAGKTRTITRRMAYGCATGQWDARRALAVTFSVKAAAQMRHRLDALGIGDHVQAATFHSAALHQLNSVWHDVSNAPFPSLMDAGKEVIMRAMHRVLGNDAAQVGEWKAAQAEINWAKISLIAPEDYVRACAATHRIAPAGLEVQRFADVYTAYEQEKSSRGQIDFNDILLMMCHVMDDDEEAANTIRSRIRWLTVDEYQDISALQHRLMSLWLGENRNICVVGDPAQTIYSFAGASSYDLLHFAEEFHPLSADVSLSTDYRSTSPIVSRANRVLSASPQRQHYLQLTAGHEGSARVTRTVYEDDAEEARAVATRIQRLTRQGIKPAQCAVLTRINAQQGLICSALRQVGLRYRVRSESGWMNSALDDDSQTRLAMLETMGVGANLAGVTVSTIHAAKGLEFRHVFIIGCSEGLLPYGSPAPGETLEEERRLMYVGITRAEDSLHLSYARRQDGYASGFTREPSRFL